MSKEKKYDLSSQETLLMNLFWKQKTKMTLAEITALAQENGFKPTIGTAKTYLQRLVKKGALATEKAGHKLLYYPAMDENSYCKKWTQSILDESFKGSLRSFVCSLTGNSKLTEEETELLRKLYDE